MTFRNKASSVKICIAAVMLAGGAYAQSPETKDKDLAPSLPETQTRQGETTGERLSRTDGVIKPPTDKFPQPQADVPAPPADIAPARPGDQQKPNSK